ncbi:unnamed protein product [Paramecium octaurelia]|uniref:Uncharacterized protein n=1 Tax=Paramecium octaurelia TaxID=43137 RepID=A0A8S1X6I3_PAROT|nr:unnamed protein product [Paramecium octaurelia]
MKKFLILLVLIVLCSSKAGDCTNAYCGAQLKACKNGGNCDQTAAKCANQFKQYVHRAQKSGQYKGTEAGYQDFTYCMSTNSAAKSLNSCSRQHCNKVLYEESIRIDEIIQSY